MIALAIATGITGLLMFFVCQPLIKREVPMNKAYGIRLPAAFESEERWYAVNEYGGRLMAKWSWTIVAAGVCGFFVPENYSWVYQLASVSVTALALIIPYVQVSRWSRR